MKKTSKFDSKIMIAAMCLAAAGLMAQTQDNPVGGTRNQNAPITSDSQSQQGGTQSQSQQSGSTNAPGQPQRINKCSSLIGTTVENQQGDKLGKIDEVVVDFDTGRVSYCVLSVEHKLFGQPKYIAVPLAAFQPSPDGDRLILNADKDKMAQAQGFDRNNWPSVTNPAWGAQPFWQSTRSTTGTPSGTTTTPIR
jgi:sporulation protein YlmC with PRC-barrel domain